MPERMTDKPVKTFLDELVGKAPAPGGTGPMTNIMLMKNVMEAARRQSS